MGIFCANFVAQLNKTRKLGGIDAGISADFPEGGEDGFRGNVADKIVSGERTATEAGEGAVEAAAARGIGGENFVLGIRGAGMEMHAEFDASDVILYLAEEFVDKIGSGGTDGVGKRDGLDANVFEPLESVLHNFRSPRFAVGIAKGHGNIDDETFVGGFGFTLEGFDKSTRLSAIHVGVGAAEIGGDGIRVADGGDALGADGALETLFIDDDADDFGKVCFVRQGVDETGHDFFAVGHLGDVLRGYKANGVDVLEAGKQKLFEIGDFGVGRDEVWEALPGVAGAFDERNLIGHLSGFPE